MRAFFAVEVSEVPRRGAELVFHVKQDKWGPQHLHKCVFVKQLPEVPIQKELSIPVPPLRPGVTLVERNRTRC